MLLAALSLIAVPFIYCQHSLLSRNYFIVGLIFVSLAVCMYEYSSDRNGLAAWFAGGKEHYQLLEKFTAMGGVDGAIASIRQQLTTNPNDSDGWFILGKLYLGKSNVIAAHDAFAMAHSLKPRDEDITNFFERTK